MHGIYRLEDEETLTLRFKYCAVGLLILALLRLVIFELNWMISDIISAIIVYFTYTSKSGVIAICCMINAMISLSYSISKLFTDTYFLLHFSHSTWFGFFTIFLFFLSTTLYFLIMFFSYSAYQFYGSLCQFRYDEEDSQNRYIRHHNSHQPPPSRRELVNAAPTLTNN
jgi:hypothetical protein